METREQLIKCLICGQHNCNVKQLKDNSDENESSLISQHLQVIFLLRNILEVPTSKLVIFLKSHPNLESWLSVCDKCTDLVNHCKSTYQAILEAQRNFRSVKQEVIQALKESALIKQEISQEELDGFQHKSIDIVEQIRGFVYQNQYHKNTDPFISGDRLAYQQLSHKVDNALKLLEVEDNQSCGANNNNDDLQEETDDDWIPSENEHADLITIKTSKSTVRKRRKALSSSSKLKKIKRGTFPCSICSKTFPYQIYLNKHIKYIHEQRHPSTCSLCGSLFTGNSALLRHTPKCTGKSIPCSEPDCPRKFDNHHALTRHLRDTHNSSKTEDPRRICSFCGKFFPKFHLLKKHIRAIHERIDNKFKCDLCGVSRTSNVDLNNHRKNCDGTSLPCPDPDCQVKCATLVSLTHHVSSTHQTNIDKLLPFKCMDCEEDKYFYTVEQLNNHKRKNHRRKLGTPKDNPSEPIPCPVAGCLQKLAGERTLKRHLRCCHDPKVIEEKRNRNICKFCQKNFLRASELDKHMRSVHEHSDLFKCDLCGVGKRTSSDLKLHRKNCKGESLSCPMAGCEMKCTSSATLSYHVTTTHKDKVDDLLPFKCVECGDQRGFLNVKQLKIHMLWKHRRKRGEGEVGGKKREKRPLICETCGGSYQGRDALTRHRRLNLTCKGLRGEGRGEEMGPVICEICGTNFKNKLSLRMHVKVVHEKRFSMTCEICGQGKNGKARMEIHMWQKHKVGDGEKWRCEVEGCTVKIYGRKDREDHMKKHRGEDPGYRCEECGKGFYMWTNIRQHVKEVHEGKRGKRRGDGGKVKEEEGEGEGDDGSNDS